MTLDELAAVKERSMSREIDALVLVRESDVRELINAAKYVGKNSADASDTVHVKKSAWFRMNDAVAELRKNCQPAALTARDAEADGMREAVRVLAGLLKVTEQEPDDPSLDELREYFAKHASASQAALG